VFAGQNLGIKQVSEEMWLVTFMDYDLGYFDHETCRLEPLANRHHFNWCASNTITDW
jgi:putative transposase